MNPDQQPTNTPLSKKKILVVEDDQFLINAYAMKLEHDGYEVLMAKNGQEALTIVETTNPDLIILDLIMPIMDGFTVLEQLKNNPSTRMIPVMIASNLGQDENIQKGLAMGAVDYLLKSDTSIDNLSEKVQGFFGSPSAS